MSVQEMVLMETEIGKLIAKKGTWKFMEQNFLFFYSVAWK